MIGKDLDEQVVEDVPAIENRRLLLGFLERYEAIQRLQSAHSLRNPLDPTLDEEEIERIQAENQAEFEKQWEEARGNIEEPPSYVSGLVDLEPIPDDPEILEYLSEFEAQDHFQNLIDPISDDRWGFRLVPIEPLVAFQPSVSTAGHQDIPTRDEGLLDVIQYTLPIRGHKYIMVQQLQSGAFTGFQLVSRGPNIDLSQANVNRDEETDIFSVNFQVKPRVNIVQVVHYGNRYILKNGYHRCFQLLSNGETHVPAFVREVDRFDETGADQPSMFNEQMIMGSRPPLLSDFLTDAAVDIDSPGQNKVIRIMAETTNIRR